MRVALVGPGETSELVATLLAAIEGVALLGVADEGVSAINLITRQKPDVAVIDIAFGGEQRGLMFARHVKRWLPSVGVVMITDEFDPDSVGQLALMFGSNWSYFNRRKLDESAILGEAISLTGRSIRWIDEALVGALSETWALATEIREREERLKYKDALPAGVAVKAKGYEGKRARSLDAPEESIFGY